MAADRRGIAIGLLYIHQLTSSPSTVSKVFRSLSLVDSVGFELFTPCFARCCLIAAECRLAPVTEHDSLEEEQRGRADTRSSFWTGNTEHSLGV